MLINLATLTPVDIDKILGNQKLTDSADDDCGWIEFLAADSIVESASATSTAS